MQVGSPGANRTPSQLPSGMSLWRLSSGQEQISVIDTAVVYSTVDTTRHLYAYDGKGKMTSDLAQKWTDGHWQDSLRETRTYDASADPAFFLSELWADGQWAGVARYWITHDASGKETSNLFESASAGSWVTARPASFVRFSSNNLTFRPARDGRRDRGGVVWNRRKAWGASDQRTHRVLQPSHGGTHDRKATGW